MKMPASGRSRDVRICLIEMVVIEEKNNVNSYRNMDQLIQAVDATQGRTEFPEINPGDTVRIQLKVIEGEKERLQAFEGVVISDRGAGASKTITVRKISHGVGVERIIPVNSPNVESITVLKHGKARRSKLFYLRKRTGKAALRVKERKVTEKA